MHTDLFPSAKRSNRLSILASLAWQVFGLLHHPHPGDVAPDNNRRPRPLFGPHSSGVVRQRCARKANNKRRNEIARASRKRNRQG